MTLNSLVRVAAKEITSLINDEERLRGERKDRKSWKSRVTGIEDYASSSNGHARPESDSRRRQQRTSGSGRGRTDEDDIEYKLAIEASKNQAEEDKRKNANKQLSDVDDDLAKAIKLSKEEEELRQRELEQSNADRLFDDATPTTVQQQPQSFQQPIYPTQYEQLGEVDFFGNAVPQQNTGYLANVYSQGTGFPQQQFAQPTGYDQNAQMQFMNPMVAQPTGYTNPYIAPVSLSPQPTQQQQSFLQPGDNNPYANNHQAAQPLQPLPTGSNNPFAPKIQNSFSNQSQSTGMPSLNLLHQEQQRQHEQQRQQQLLQQQQEQQRQQQQRQQQQQSYQNQSYQQSFAPSSPTPAEKPVNPQHAHLENLLAAGNANGLDTFGNVGDLRIPAQHTAPSMFVNSAGTSRTGRPMAAQSTGNNPFFSQQFTGVPQSTGFGGSLSPQPNRLMPAHTGPAGMNGFGGYQQQQSMGNPYAGGFGQQQQPQKQQGGNLIDL